MGGASTYDCELRLGLPGTRGSGADVASETKTNKRLLTNIADDSGSRTGLNSVDSGRGNDHAIKAQIVGWPPIRSYRKNSLQPKKETAEDSAGVYVKVSLDGAPYLRKIDLNSLKGYSELLLAIEAMFKISIGNYSESQGYAGSDYEPTYEDKDGDWMLVGDVPWVMFATSCKRLRIMRNAEAAPFG